jgi:hypothetical protein
MSKCGLQLMAESTLQVLRWAFEGVGGAAVVGLAGWLWHVFAGKPDAAPPDSPKLTQGAHDVRGDANISESQSAGVGAASTLQNSPVIAGSNNTVHYHPTPNEQADELGWLGGTLVFIALVAALCVVLYFVLHETHTGTPVDISPAPVASPKAESSRPRRSAGPENAEASVPGRSRKARAEVGLAFSDRLTSKGFGAFESESCVTTGVTCLGEEKIKGKTITVPLQHGTHWQRIVLLVSTFEAGLSDLDNPHVVVSTTSPDVGLSYASHRDGEFRKHLEFTDELFSTTRYNEPDSFTLDIELGSGIESFPLKVEVWADGLPHHVVSFAVHPSVDPGS